MRREKEGAFPTYLVRGKAANDILSFESIILDFYKLELAGITRKLPIVAVSEELEIASFVILGATELVCNTADIIFLEELPLFPQN